MNRKNDVWLAIGMAVCTLMGGSATAQSAGKTFYVSPAGKDSWSGSLPAPNPASSNGPFLTLDKARDAVRTYFATHPDARSATVALRGGTYLRANTLDLTAEDAAKPVTYRAFGKEQVHIVGSIPITNWQPVTDAAILERLDPAARGKVLQADLSGSKELEAAISAGFSRSAENLSAELFFAEKPMTLARWPNGGEYATIKSAPKGQTGSDFTCDSARLARWASAPDAWLHGYWTFDWADSYVKIGSVDPATHTITTLPPYGVYGYSPGRRFYVLNLLEELDEPGEYYLDRISHTLYFWPPAPIAGASARISVLSSPLIKISGAQNIHIEGITFEETRGEAIAIQNAVDCVVAGCTIRNTGTNGISIVGGSRCGVLSCNLYNLGDTGVTLSGGDRQTLKPGLHFVENCDIHHQSRLDFTYRPAIGLDGVGNRASSNRLHDGPHNAILMGGNDHIVEYNEIYRVCTQTGDAGAVYMGRDLAQRGTVVRFNHFHDIGPTLHAKESDRYTEVMAVYLDDCYCGVTIRGNLFERAGRSIMVGGGRDNTIENNLFVDCSPSIHIDQRGKSWASKYFVPDGEWHIFEHLKAVPYNKEPYLKYPHLASVMEEDPSSARYNRVLNNIHVGKGKWIDWLDGMSEKTVEVKGNYTEGDPGFVNLAGHDYRLRPDSPALKTGFQPIPFARIGLHRDRYRAALAASPGEEK
jgi:Right handed beta helix region